MIKAVLFDIDGVLFDSVRANAWFYRKMGERFGFTGPTDEEMRQLNHLSFKDVMSHFLPGAECISSGEAIQYAHTLEDRSDLLDIPKEADAVLQELSKRYAMGVVTQRVKKSLGPKLDAIGMGQYFPLQVGFEDTEKHKPHPEPLLFAGRRLGFSPSEIVYIGDADTDIQAAKAAGMKMIHFSTEAVPGDHKTVSRFQDLISMISTFS